LSILRTFFKALLALLYLPFASELFFQNHIDNECEQILLPCPYNCGDVSELRRIQVWQSITQSINYSINQ